MNRKQDAQVFVKNLKLTDLSKAILGLELIEVPFEEGQPAASIIGGSIIAFTGNVSGQQRSDLKNATCLAQLAAMKKHDPFTDTENFYKFYTDILASIGFVIQGFDFTKHEISGTTFSVDKIAIEILAAIATGNEVALVQASLDALKSLSDDDDRLRLFSSNSHSSEYANFMIGIATQEANGDVAFKVGAFKMDSEQNNTRFLWFSYSTSETNLFKSSQTVTLNTDVYSQVRQEIIDKLGIKATQFITDLEI